MTYYIRHKETGEDLIIEDIDVEFGIVLTQEKGEIPLVDVIEKTR
jgi:hypothetical protein